NGYCAGVGCVVPRGGGGRGVLGWLLLALGVGAALVIVLGVIGYVVQKRQQALAALAMTPEQLAQSQIGATPGPPRTLPRPPPPPGKGAGGPKAPPPPPPPPRRATADHRAVAARHDRPTRRPARPAAERLHDRKSADLRPRPRRRLHLRPARAGRRGSARQL